MKNISAPDFIDLLKSSPPAENESLQAYTERIGQIMGRSSGSITTKIKRILKRNNLLQSSSGLQKLLNQKPALYAESPEQLTSWRDYIEPVKALQESYKKASLATNYPQHNIKTDSDICVVCLADLHLGSSGTDYTLFEKITEELLNIPNLYAIIPGDALEMAIKLRGVKEVAGNILTPEHQLNFLESWLKDVQHKILLATWGNHAVMREERQVGYSATARIFQKYVPWSNGISHLDLTVNDQVYKFAINHWFKGNSIYSKVAGQKRYCRDEAPERHIFVAGHTHQPEINTWLHAGQKRLAINTGTLKVKDGYGSRFFSLTSHPVFPCTILKHDEFDFYGAWSVKEWMK